MFLKFNRRGVRVGFALVGGVCVSLPLLKCSAVRAAAADLEYISLSTEQTLALYGTHIVGEYYNGSNVVPVDLQYMGSTIGLSKTWGDGSEYLGHTYFSKWLMQDQYSSFIDQAMAWESDWLIYRWETTNVVSAPNFDFSLRLNLSVDISAYGFGQAVLWSRSSASLYPGVNAGLSQYRSSFTMYGDTVQDVIAQGSYLTRPNVGSEYGIARTYFTPCKFYNSNEYWHGDDIMTTFLGMSCLAGSKYTGGESVNVKSETLTFKMERPVQQYQGIRALTDTNGNPTGGYEFYDYTDPAVYIMIQCPVLYGDYILPPGNAGNSVDLSIIEGYLADSNDYLLNISEESTVQTRQLIAILAKLEQIYQKIPSVDLSVPTLSTAPSIPIDSELDSRISADLESGAELLPDISESFDTEKMQSFSDLLTRVRSWFPAEIITLGGLSLALAFVTWLLFRGRGS